MHNGIPQKLLTKTVSYFFLNIMQSVAHIKNLTLHRKTRPRPFMCVFEYYTPSCQITKHHHLTSNKESKIQIIYEQTFLIITYNLRCQNHAHTTSKPYHS